MNTKSLADELRSVKTEQYIMSSNDMTEKAVLFYKKVHSIDHILLNQNMCAGHPYSREEITRMAVLSVLSDTFLEETRL